MAIAELFGWSLERIMALTLPQFLYIHAQLEDLHYLRTLRGQFFGTLAVWGDDGARLRLAQSAKRLYRNDADADAALDYTPEALAIAERRAEEYFRSKHMASEV